MSALQLVSTLRTSASLIKQGACKAPCRHAQAFGPRSQHVRFFLSGLAQRQSGSTLMASLRENQLKCREAADRREAVC